VEFYVRNILQVPLLLSEVQILWKHSVTGWKRKASVSTETSEEPKELTNDTLTKQVRMKNEKLQIRMLFIFRLINLLNVIFLLIA
jgi:hypothetical protein